MFVTVSYLEVLELVYDLDHVIIFPLIITFCSVTEDSLLGVSYFYCFRRTVFKVVFKVDCQIKNFMIICVQAIRVVRLNMSYESSPFN